ncbi:MAG: DNA polymerase III subunit chi [Gammaproteobacteria bacterium]|jgi:DNA polymerase-3 subunit chi|nr:DNA polymerase III subunit chi [Gammaproteobacteria bacterium]
MTRVDFYILQDSRVDARQQFTCKLTEKAYKQGHRVYINTASEQQLKQLDELLWTFRDGSFLPHECYHPGAAGDQPILLGHAIEPDTPNDVLVNLADDIPAFFSRFNRVAELVGGDDAQRQSARDRYRFYKDRGYTLKTHKL